MGQYFSLIVIRITVEIVLSNSETEFVIDSLGSSTDQLIPSCVHKGSRWLPDEGDREDGGEAGDRGDGRMGERREKLLTTPSLASSPSPPSLCTTARPQLSIKSPFLPLTPSPPRLA